MLLAKSDRAAPGYVLFLFVMPLSVRDASLLLSFSLFATGYRSRSIALCASHHIGASTPRSTPRSSLQNCRSAALFAPCDRVLLVAVTPSPQPVAGPHPARDRRRVPSRLAATPRPTPPLSRPPPPFSTCHPSPPHHQPSSPPRPSLCVRHIASVLVPGQLAGSGMRGTGPLGVLLWFCCPLPPPPSDTQSDMTRM